MPYELGKYGKCVWYGLNVFFLSFQWKYKIRFEGKGMKVLGGRFIALQENPAEVLPVGSRIIGL